MSSSDLRCPRARRWSARSPADLAATALALAVVSPAWPGCVDSGPPSYETRWEVVDCAVETPADRRTECGVLTVPEDRAAPPPGPPPAEARPGWVRLAVAIVRGAGGDGARAPLVYLSGGPGYGEVDALTRLISPAFGTARDLVFFDQRGVGRSTPGLQCAEYGEAAWAALGVAAPLAVELDLVDEAARACRQRLEAAGVELAAYNTIESARDAQDLRRALGIERWDVYGISYGTALAQQLMRADPEGTRKVVLDSVYAIDEVRVDQVALAAERAFEQLFAGCAADADCAAVHPSLRDELWGVVDAFNAEPYTATVADPAGGEARSVAIDGQDLVAGVFGAMYDAGWIPQLPGLLKLVADRNNVILNQLVREAAARALSISYGMYLSVECHDRARGVGRADVERVGAERPWAGSLYTYLGLAPCEVWGVPAAEPSFNALVRGAIPTLVLAGSYDPVTPPAGSERVADALDSATYLEFPQVGHGALRASPCAEEIVAGFLDDDGAQPPASACLADERPPDF